MANMCSNYVTFSGSEDNVKKFIEEVKALAALSKETNEGVRPGDNGRYMFDLQIYDLEEGYFSFDSKWAPALYSLETLGRKHSVDIVCDYEELGCMIFGRWEYDAETNCQSDITLTEEEIDSVEEDDENGTCFFEGEKYACRNEVLELILERKINSLS